MRLVEPPRSFLILRDLRLARWVVRTAEGRGCRQIPDRLADLFPRALCGPNAEGQLKALRKGKEAYGADGLAIAGPFDHASVPRL